MVSVRLPRSGQIDHAVARKEASGKVGPPLTAFAMRTYIAGEVPSTPANLKHWIQHPHDIEQHTAMPEMGVTDEDSKDIAAYLYTLH